MGGLHSSFFMGKVANSRTTLAQANRSRRRREIQREKPARQAAQMAALGFTDEGQFFIHQARGLQAVVARSGPRIRYNSGQTLPAPVVSRDRVSPRWSDWSDSW